MKILHPRTLAKKLCCMALSGCLLWSSSALAYTHAVPTYGMSYSSQTRHTPAPGEYFYTQLTTDEQAVYDAILSQIDALTTDNTDPSGVQVSVPSGTVPSLKPVFAVFRDHPEFFWVDSSKFSWAEGNPATDGNGNDIYALSCWPTGESFFYPGFTVDNLQDFRDRFAAKIEEIRQGVPATAKDTVSILKYLNNWMASNNVYNTKGLSASNFSRCAASGLLSDNTTTTPDDDPVCYGYATAMKALLDAFGIENAYIEGWAYNTTNRPNGEQHAWNYVKLDDGTGREQWYAIDPIWDDPVATSLPARGVYFLVGSNTRTEENLPGYETFSQNHDSTPAKSPAYTKHQFTYPALAAEALQSGNVTLEKADGSNQNFDTLENAMNAASAGDKLILQNAVEVTNTIVLKDGVTLDLNGQTGGRSPARAVTGAISPLFRVEANTSASIINSGVFTGLETKATSITVIDNQGNLSLGTNLQLVGGTTMGTGPIAGNPPVLAPHTRYYTYTKTETAYLVAEPAAPAPGSFPAQSGMTVQNLLDGFPSLTPVVSLQYYGNSGNLTPVPSGEYTLDWQLRESPNGGSAIAPTASLENGLYRFEASAFDYSISYQVEVTGLSVPPQEITAVSLSGLDAPIAGQPLDTAITADTASVTASGVTWPPADSTAAYDTAYIAAVTLTAAANHTFAPAISVTVNNQPAQAEAQPDGTLIVRYAFPATSAQPIYLQSIQPPAAITAAHGTALQALPLPTQVDILTTDGQIRKADVAWTLTPTDGTSYQPDLPTAQVFRLSGTVTLPAGIDANGLPLTVTIEVTVSAAPAIPQAAAPTAQPAPGRYETNQSVILTSSTPNAAIYYTLDGSAPSATHGTLYTAPIALNGTEGQSVKTTIRAIAVAANFQDSPAVALEYEIALPASSGSSSSCSSSSGNPSQTTKNPDGSITTTVIYSDGSTKATTRYTDGTTQVVKTTKNGVTITTITLLPGRTTETVTQPDGLSQTTIKHPNGKEEILRTASLTQDGMLIRLSSGETVKIVDNRKVFSDVPASYWGTNAVQFVTSREIFSGMSGSAFAPDTAMNRAMIVTVLARLDGVDTGSGKNWYEIGRQWAMRKGVSDGTNMTDPLTREQLASMLYRYAGEPAVTSTLARFSDAESVSSWASDAVCWAVSSGLISGMGGSTLAPQSTATRAQVAQILMQFISR